MTTYIRVDGSGAFDAFVNVSASDFAALQANGKAARLRLYTIDAQPAPGVNQYVADGPIVYTATTANKTWLLVTKTPEQIQAEADAAALTAEAQTNAQLIIDIKTQLDINNPAFNALTDPQKIAVLRDDRRLSLRACRYLLRRVGT